MDVWPMPLHQRPTVLACGVVDHGQQPVDRWWMPRTWTLHLYHYEADLVLDGVVHRIKPGCAGIIAPGVQQEYRYGGLSRHVYAHLELPAGGPAVPVPVPVLVDLGAEAPAFRARFEAAVGDFAVQPMRCHVRAWDLLWELARRVEDAGGAGGDPRLTTAMAHIERELEGTFAIPDLARRVGLSHNQLTRLFRTHLGDTVVGYIRRRRIEKAVYLLTRTDLSIRSVAAQVGIPDAQAFTKTMRAVAGRAPSEFRR